MHHRSLVRPFPRLARLTLLAIVLCVLTVGLTTHRAEVAMAAAPTQSGIGGSTSLTTSTTRLAASVPTANAPASAPPDTSPAPQSRSLYRAISLNGKATTIDGLGWEGADAPNLSIEGTRFCNQSVPLIPSTDANRAAMISLFSLVLGTAGRAARRTQWRLSGVSLRLGGQPPRDV